MIDLTNFDYLQREIDRRMLRGHFNFEEDDPFCVELIKLLNEDNPNRIDFIKTLIEAAYECGTDNGYDTGLMWGSRF